MFNDLKKNIERYRLKKEFLGSLHDKEMDRNSLSFCIKIIPKVLNSEHCNVFIHNPETGVIWLKSGTGMSEKQIEVSNGDSVVGRVIKTGNWENISNVEELPGLHRKIAEETGFITRNLLCVPIMSLDGKSVTGAIEVSNKKDGEFTDEDQKLAMEMGQSLQLTIENDYFNQEIFGSLESTFSILKKITLAAISIIVGLLLLLMFYTFGASYFS